MYIQQRTLARSQGVPIPTPRIALLALGLLDARKASVPPSELRGARVVHAVDGLVALAAPLALLDAAGLQGVVNEYELLGGWFVPFACVVYVPIVLQSWIAACVYF